MIKELIDEDKQSVESKGYESLKSLRE